MCVSMYVHTCVETTTGQSVSVPERVYMCVSMYVHTCVETSTGLSVSVLEGVCVYMETTIWSSCIWKEHVYHVVGEYVPTVGGCMYTLWWENMYPGAGVYMCSLGWECVYLVVIEYVHWSRSVYTLGQT